MNASLTIKQATLKHGLASVSHAMDTDSSRYTLAGVRMVIEPGQIIFVATDGRRMAVKTVELDHHCDPLELTIPRKTALELSRRLYKGHIAELTIAQDKVAVRWMNGRGKRQLTEFKPLEGRYPRWREVIPKTKEYTGTLSGPADLLLPFFAPSDAIDLRVNGKAEVYSEPREVKGSTIATRDKPKRKIEYRGEFDLTVNRNLIADFLVASSDCDALLSVIDSDSPIVCTSSDGLLEIIMPLSRHHR